MSKPTFDHTALHALDTRFVPAGTLTPEQIAAGKAAVARQEHGWFETPANAEPLYLTLEQAMRMNALNSEGEYPFVDVWVNAEGEWWTKSLGAPKQQHAGWPEAYSVAFGRPVVARDEAAEMRAENAKLRAAARAWLAAERHTRIINAGATPEARRAYREARGVLKRLAETLVGEEERE